MENQILKALINKGVQIPNPESVHISKDIRPDRISCRNVVIHTGCKLFGHKTLISDGCELGHEAPVTIDNAILGPNTRLNGGYFKGVVFAGDNVFGSGAHVREGTILEEQASAAHTVGLKQTILFPFVTLGSLINFCDCFMAGGTSRRDHSEVGSSYIHFNYTPNQDKATASIMGDVPHGVMLRSKPIFLGGQGGLVGPVRMNYGCMTAAGSIIRKNELKKDRLLVGGGLKTFSMPRTPFVYKNISHIFNNNIFYISSLIALRAWYRHLRPLFCFDFFSTERVQAMQENLDSAISERIKRFEAFAGKLKESQKIIRGREKNQSSEVLGLHQVAINKKSAVLERFEEKMDTDFPEEKIAAAFLQGLEQCIDPKDYISSIRNLKTDRVENAIRWLKQVQENTAMELFI